MKITKKEVKLLQIKAKEKNPNDVFGYYYDLEKMIREMLHKKTGKNLKYVTSTELLYNNKMCPPQLEEEIYSEDGFTKQEYEKLTGRKIPHIVDHGLLKENKNGKISLFKEAGNISMIAGSIWESYGLEIKNVWIKFHEKINYL